MPATAEQLEKRRAYWREWAKQKRIKDGDSLREYQRSQYAKHREKRAAEARERRAANREQYNAKSLERYHANRDEKNAQRRERMSKKSPEDKAKIYAKILEWKKQNPDRELFHHAKRLLAESTGMRFSDVPDDLAEAKVMQILIHRLTNPKEAGVAQ